MRSQGPLGRTIAGRRGPAAAALALLGLGAVVAGRGWPQADVPLWSVLALATVLLSATALATYVPAAGAGWRPDLGCGSCAAVSGLAAAGSVWYVATSPVALGAGLLGLAVSGFALVKRLTDPEVCATSARPAITPR